MNTEAKPSTRLRTLAGPGLVAALAVLFMVLRWSEFPVGAGMDDAYYIELARSLAEGRGPVIHLGGPGPGWRPDIFPLGFPLMLSPVALLVPDSVQIFKLIPLLALLSLVPLCLRLARVTNPRTGLALAAVVCLNPWTVAFATRVFSDLPFTAVSLAAVLLFLNEPRDGHQSRRSVAALILATAFAIMLRSIGLALLVAMILSRLSHRRWRSALVLLGGVAVVLLPHALAGGGPGGGLVTGAYLDQVFSGQDAGGSRAAFIAANGVGYLKELPVILLPVFGVPLESLAERAGLGSLYGPFQLLTGVLLAAGILWGWLIGRGQGRPGTRFPAIFLVIYGGVLVNFSGYPSGVQTRLLLPLLPLMYLGLFRLLEAPARPGLRRLPTAAAALILTLAVVHNVYRVARPLTGSADTPFINPEPGSAWVREHTGPEDRIMTRWPLRQHIHFLRPVVGFGTVETGDPERSLERYGVDHVFLGPGPHGEESSALRDVIKADPRRYRPVHREAESSVEIFSIRKDP